MLTETDQKYINSLKTEAKELKDKNRELEIENKRLNVDISVLETIIIEIMKDKYIRSRFNKEVSK